MCHPQYQKGIEKGRREAEEDVTHQLICVLSKAFSLDINSIYILAGGTAEVAPSFEQIKSFIAKNMEQYNNYLEKKLAAGEAAIVPAADVRLGYLAECHAAIDQSKPVEVVPEAKVVLVGRIDHTRLDWADKRI